MKKKKTEGKKAGARYVASKVKKLGNLRKINAFSGV